ncbi:MAG: right-handed parallel beta-helix repeat-containing protein [Thalassotalea sp.]|nr:right-handed parallel beta-helix repeat-containing protein [Thalassotalea sp.]
MLKKVGLILLAMSGQALANQDICLEKTFTVSNVILFEDIIKQSAHCNSQQTIRLKPGHYSIYNTIQIKRNNLTIQSLSNNPNSVTIAGDSMSPDAKIGNVFRISGKNIKISGLTIEKSGYHLIQIAGESGAQSPIIENNIFRDSYQQMIKVTFGKDLTDRVKNGIVRNNHFEYSAGIGPNWYIGGIDAHGMINWQVTHNYFRNIASPKQQVAEHAIHIWNQSADNLVANNTIINCDRGIGFGMGKRGNAGGKISKNNIYHKDNNHLFSDVGISIESSPGTLIENNLIILEHGYPSAIEYRFAQTTDVKIKDNRSNKPIQKRNSAKARLTNNQLLTQQESEELILKNFNQ